MKKNISIKIKAALLLIVFSMNTVIGFACAMGVDMGFNSQHHDQEEPSETAIHVHADGKKHNHHDEVSKLNNNSKEDSENDGCCNDGVIKFQNLVKNLNQNTQVIYAPIFANILNNFWSIHIFNCIKVLPQHYKVCVFHPPRTDILIAIQRFQI